MLVLLVEAEPAFVFTAAPLFAVLSLAASLSTAAASAKELEPIKMLAAKRVVCTEI
jgi:hypothetical protein